jgi:hypothetical protein
MRSTLQSACVVGALLLAAPGVARAAGGQKAGGQKAQAGAPFSLGLRAYGVVDLDSVAAKQSFDAELGTSQLKAFGGGVDVVDIWKHLFARVAVTRARKKGSRAFVTGGQVFPLGIPITVTMTPVEVGGGWRFAGLHGRVTPYAGAAFVSMGYADTSKFADPAENTSARFKGGEVFGGVEVAIVKWVAASADAQYRRVPNALGTGGVSKDFKETDLGGFTVRVAIGIRTKR